VSEIRPTDITSRIFRCYRIVTASPIGRGNSLAAPPDPEVMST
jgi:hypothetical protein